jgi:chemotaxis signal transduction protein
MQLEEGPVGEHVMALRRSFDAAFSDATRVETAGLEDLLAIGLGQRRYALRRTDVSALVADKAVTRLPGAPPALLGIAGFRGQIIPVYDLRVLLGEDATTQPRWLVLGVTEPRYGLAFDQFEGYLRAPREAIVARDDSTAPHPGAQELLHCDGQVRAVVHAKSVTHAIEILIDGRGSGRMR